MAYSFLQFIWCKQHVFFYQALVNRYAHVLNKLVEMNLHQLYVALTVPFLHFIRMYVLLYNKYI